jgi:hypothetical protein
MEHPDRHLPIHPNATETARMAAHPEALGDDRLPERFWIKVRFVPITGCWRWVASLNTGGYGQLNVDRRPRLAYRLAYEALVGPVPRKLQLDHLCQFRQCVNPWHLEVVTNRENVLRGYNGQFGTVLSRRNAAKTECPNGHPYSGDNLLVWTRKTNDGKRTVTYRTCRTCSRDRNREWKRKRSFPRSET